MPSTNSTKSSFGRNWPLWLQIAFSALLITLIFTLISGELVRRAEYNYLLAYHEKLSEKITETIASTMIDAMITEDTALLNTIISQSATSNSDIIGIEIKNEDGKKITTWRKDVDISDRFEHRLGKPLEYEGEVFGSFIIIWDTSSHNKEIERKSNDIRTIVAFMMMILALLIIGIIHLLVIRPLKSINKRLHGHLHGKDHDSLPKHASREFSDLDKTVDHIKNLTVSTELLREEVLRRKRAQTDLARAKDDADEANKHKSIFLANMSHELRTPLNAIIGYSELLKEDADTENNKGLLTDLNNIHSSGQHLLHLVNDILDLSKIEAGRSNNENENIIINDLISDIASLSHPLAEQNNNTMDVTVDKNIGNAFLDKTKLKQILLNLISNACKFTQNGVINLIAKKVSDNSNYQLIFEVKDSGIGISSRDIEHIFDPFSQADQSTKKKYGGTGLGLSITNQLCKTMSGSLTVSSSPGEGSIFIVTLPANANVS